MLVRLTGSPENAHRVWLPVVIVSAVVILRELRRIHDRRPWLAEAIALAAMLLLSPVSWLHHWILVLPFVIACFRLFAERKHLRRIGLGMTLALCTGLWIGLVWNVPNTQQRERHLNLPQTLVGDSDVLLLIATVGIAVAASRAANADEVAAATVVGMA